MMEKPKKRYKTGLLVVNLGTPDAAEVPAVRRYLREFLMDGRVIDIPAVLRFILVNGIIAPFRAPKSTKTYKEVWTDKGSPLKVYGNAVVSALQEELKDEMLVVLGMRYQNPSLESALEILKNEWVEKIIVLPLFPQYASATTGSVMEKVMRIMADWQVIPELAIINSYFSHPTFIDAFVERGKHFIENEQWDKILFTYHGIPARHIRKADPTGKCLTSGCCDTLHAGNRHCYKAQCYATSRLLAEKFNLKAEEYFVSFQSRLGNDPWLEPYTEDVAKDFPKQGLNKVLAFSPSFVADCLETTIEVGDEYKEMFEEAGGKHWQLVDSLNDSPIWIEALTKLARHYAQPIEHAQ